ncbi:hypothetical protein BZB76_0043 [Actinomadura pelletieri DSM 43383]|uniref:Uncharacterized protein n=1 Tax=Actinomadura pelletieri DSM 43383 TaxID=1120940 RepID=A0A495QXI3_9ACTN|nr:hypothetical protein [Actinomadura pelletieri]RKS78626.1 hypothetical protein BZB76_0043 [Actinomadura pelletieri DSM 43383]
MARSRSAKPRSKPRAKPRSTRRTTIGDQCKEIIATSVNGDHYGAYEAFAAMTHRRDFPEIGPVMAEAFIEIIQRGCRAVGAVTGDGLPDVSRFLVDERTSITRVRTAVPSMTGQDMVKVRGIHRANARAAQQMVQTYAAQGRGSISTLYQERAAAQERGAENVLIMLWGTAINVQRQVRDANVNDARGPN